MKAPLPIESKVWGRSEIFLAGLLVAAFLAINLLVATRTPTVNNDEPSYCDAAVNLYFGSGFTSTQWGQDRHEFWSANVPLYQGILFCSYKIFGFSLFETRAVNSFLAAFSAILIWCAVRRAGFISQPFWRLMLLALILSGSSTTVTFRTARPDTTMFLVCALFFFLWVWAGDSWRRRVLPMFAAMLMPFAGISLLPYAGMVSILTVIFFRKKGFALAATLGAGWAAGVAALFVFYSHFHAWQSFVKYILPFTVVGTGGSKWHQKIFGEAPGTDNLLTSFFGHPLAVNDLKIMFDHSAAILFLIFVLVAWRAWSRFANTQRQFVLFIILLTLLVPPVMHIAGHYRAMYRWMTYIPLCVATPWLSSLIDFSVFSKARQKLIFTALALALLMGIPAHTVQIFAEWRARSPALMKQIVTPMVRRTDVVVCTRRAYFTVRPLARMVFLTDMMAGGDFTLIKDFPRSEISLLVLPPGDLPSITNIVGTDWHLEKSDASPAVVEALMQTRFAVECWRHGR